VGADEVDRREGIPCTSIDRVLARCRRRKAPRLRAILAPWRQLGEDRPLLRSVLETRLLAVILDAQLSHFAAIAGEIRSWRLLAIAAFGSRGISWKTNWTRP
jgi:hypothetical protein